MEIRCLVKWVLRKAEGWVARSPDSVFHSRTTPDSISAWSRTALSQPRGARTIGLFLRISTRITVFGRSTFCTGVFARRSKNRDLFVLTVLRNAPRSLLLEIKGGDLSPNRTRQHPHETPPTSSSPTDPKSHGLERSWFGMVDPLVFVRVLRFL